MNMFQGGFPPNYPLNTDHMQNGCAQNQGPKMDSKTAKFAGLVLIVNQVLKSDYATLKAWQDSTREDFAVDEYIYLVTKKLMEMSEDEFIKYQNQYRQEIRQRSKGSDQQGDPHRQERSCESDANLFRENGGTNC